MKNLYDVAIVGAGTAGCVLASRLSEDPARQVVLFEAGPDYPPGTLPPDLADGIHGTSTASHDWGLHGTGVDGGPPLALPQGRVTGGSSAVNATFALRGHPADYDGWALHGWKFEDVLPSFLRLEHDLDFGSAPYHGTDGPVPIRRYRGDECSELTLAMEGAIASVGIPRIPDHNAPGAVGVSGLPVNCVRGTRVSTALAYLDPVRSRPNLTIRADSPVAEVLVGGGRASGVRTTDGQITAADEVIVCAGAYHSPALLIRSGIGPAGDITALGRSVAVELPGVGHNLADHPWVAIELPCLEPQGDPPIFQVVATARSSRSSSADPPDLQFMVCGPYRLGDGYRCLLAAALLKPVSRGQVRLLTLDPVSGPAIDLGYFRDPVDIDRLAEGLQIAKAAVADPDLARLTRGPRPATRPELVGDDAVRDWIKATATTYHHPVGTCAMGTDPRAGAVVDTAGWVYGVPGLSVVDASILPGPLSANTNIPTIMAAEHVAARRRGDGAGL
ncbi:MAG TPA: GMC oxidoreductase [Arthrobacter sp.]|jgi:choline dehydrogenase